MIRSGVRSIPISSAQSKSSARLYRFFVLRAAAESYSCRQRAARPPFQISACITQPSGRSKGFIEAVAQEVAHFNIEFTIVEPGVAKTNFGVSLVRAPAMAVYESTPAGELRRGIAAAAFRVPGDPLKMVQAMIDSAERKPAPARLALGSDTYALVRTALMERIAALDAQKDIALSTDVSA